MMKDGGIMNVRGTHAGNRVNIIGAQKCGEGKAGRVKGTWDRGRGTCVDAREGDVWHRMKGTWDIG